MVWIICIHIQEIIYRQKRFVLLRNYFFFWLILYHSIILKTIHMFSLQNSWIIGVLLMLVYYCIVIIPFLLLSTVNSLKKFTCFVKLFVLIYSIPDRLKWTFCHSLFSIKIILMIFMVCKTQDGICLSLWTQQCFGVFLSKKKN